MRSPHPAREGESPFRLVVTLHASPEAPRQRSKMGSLLATARTVAHSRLPNVPAIFDEALEVNRIKPPNLAEFARRQNWSAAAVGVFNNPSTAHAEHLADTCDGE